MNNAIIQLLILAAVAVFLVFRLKNLLGTREGFEKSAENTVVKIKEKRVKSPKFECSVLFCYCQIIYKYY